MSTLEKIAVMQAEVDGKAIEFRYKGRSDWRAAACPSYNWEEREYRIKPEPVVKPWTFENAPHLVLRIRRKSDRVIGNARLYPDGIYFGASMDSATEVVLTYERLAADYIQWNDLPCGTID